MQQKIKRPGSNWLTRAWSLIHDYAEGFNSCDMQNPARVDKYSKAYEALLYHLQEGADALHRGSDQLVANLRPVGLGWKVRERRNSDGELLDCFVEASQVKGRAYGCEVLRDDYVGYGGVEGKLKHCHMIVAWANAATLPQPDAQAIRDAALDYADQRVMASRGRASEDEVKEAWQAVCELLKANSA